MDTRTDIASRLMAGLFAGNPEMPFMAATEIATKGADDLMKYLEETAPGEVEPKYSPQAKAAQEPAQEPQAMPAQANTTLRDLGVSGRACAPLERMDVETLGQLAVQSRKDISKVRGVSTDTLKQFDALLEENGLSWDWSPSETVSDDEDEEDDLL